MSLIGELSPYQIAIAGGLILATIALSKACGLRLEKTFGVAALRCVVQLSLIGYALRWLFGRESLGLNLLALGVMTLVAGQTVVSRVEVKSWRLFGFALVSLIGGVWLVAVPSIRGLFGETAIFEAKLFILLMGLLLGNALSRISLTFVQLQKIRRESMREIETFRALGGTGWESCARLYRAGLRQALTPIINAMSVVGVVSLPGTMAGQVLGGVDPLLAGRVQIVIMFLILLTSLLGALIAIALFHAAEMPEWVRVERVPLVFTGTQYRRFALSGASGVGKSRFLKSLVGLDDKDVSRMIIDKSEVELSPVDFGAVIYLSQHPIFIPGSVLENLRHPFQFQKNVRLKFDEKKMEILISQIGLPKTILDNSALSLSGGEAQVVHFVRAALLDPQIFLLDEPTSALDRERKDQFEIVLNDWVRKNGRQFIVISHDPDQRLRMSDVQWSLIDGRLIPA